MAALRPSLLPLLACAVLTGCGWSQPAPSILLVTLDTTRADRIGCYGYAKAETPALDSLAASGVRFDRAYAQAPLTLASHASLLTGTYPATTGLRINADAILSTGVHTLAERLKPEGYRTGAFVSSFVLDSTFGLDRGFDRYDDDLVRGRVSRHFELERPANLVTDAALGWLDEPSKAPFFAWVHLYSAHAPYAPPEPFRSRHTDPYDGEIAFADSQLRRLLDWVESKGQSERTIVIVAADHGESFLDHGEPEHGLFVYDTTIRVPLVVAWAGKVPAGTSAASVQLVDVYPTVLELLGQRADPQASGASLAAALRGAALGDRTAYGESLYSERGYGWAPLRYVVRGALKLIEAPRPELYDHDADPGETDNRAERQASDVASLRASLLEIEGRITPAEPGSTSLNPEVAEKLRSLGYVGTSGGTPSGVPVSGDPIDPKDRIDVYRDHARAFDLLRARQYKAAATVLEGLIARSPESYVLHEDLGMAYLSLNRLDEALHSYETSLLHVPDDPDRMWGHAEVLRRLGRLDEAIAAFQQATVRWTSLGEAYLGLALCHVSRNDFAQAYEPAKKYAELTPGSKLALGNLANVCLALRKYDEAVAAASQLVDIDGKSVEGHYVRWEALRAARKPLEAIEALRHSRDSLPADWLLTCSLAWMLAVTPDSGGEPGEAVRLAQICVQQNPRHPRSYDVLGAAHAERGSYADAVKAARQALALAEGPQAAPARQAIQARLSLYDAGQPFRE